MQIRCYRCGMSFSLNKDEARFALMGLKESGGAHYDARCPRCRHANRISVEQLQRIAPSTREEDQTDEEADADAT